MENGLLILGLIGLLFLCMYGYSYGTVARERVKEKRKQQELDRLQELKKEERAKRRKIYNEKLAKLKRRSEEIRLELQRLEKVNLNTDSKDKQKVEQIKNLITTSQKAG